MNVLPFLRQSNLVGRKYHGSLIISRAALLGCAANRKKKQLQQQRLQHEDATMRIRRQGLRGLEYDVKLQTSKHAKNQILIYRQKRSESKFAYPSIHFSNSRQFSRSPLKPRNDKAILYEVTWFNQNPGDLLCGSMAPGEEVQSPVRLS